MKKVYCIKCRKYRKFKNTKISCIFDTTLVLSIICDKCSSNDKEVFKKEESIEILKTLGLINNVEEYQMNK